MKVTVLTDVLPNYPMLDSLKRIGPLKLASIPKKLNGLSVLDIGGYDGRFAWGCRRRGAARAVCLENEEWAKYNVGTWPKPEKFPYVEFVQGDFLDWQESFDLVLCFNVLYHCARWEEAAFALRRLTRGELCVSVYVASGTSGWVPYVEEGTGYQKATPTVPGLIEALASAGFPDYPHTAVRDGVIILRCA